MSLLVLLAAGAILGLWALRLLRLEWTAETAAFSLLTGLAMTAIAVTAIGSWALWAAQLAVFLIAFIGFGIELRREVKRHTPHGPLAGLLAVPPAGMEIVALAALAGACLIAAVSALAPSTSWDAAVAHLALPAAYTREGRISVFEGNAYSAYPHLIHSLYTWAYYLGGEASVQQMGWWFAVLAAASVYALGRRTANRRTGLIAAALLATAPVFFDQAGTASIDLAFVAFATAALAAFAAWAQSGRIGWLALSAFLAGSSCGVRHTGYVVGLMLFAAAAYSARGQRARSLGVFCALAGLGAAPWLMRSALATGNPFFPFFASVFGHNAIPDFQPATFGTHSSLKGIGWRSLLMFPWNIVMRPDHYDGWSKSPGAMVLWLGVPGLVWGGPKARWLGLYAVLGGLFFFYFQQTARYVLPFFAAMMVVAAMAADRILPLRKAINVLLVFTFVYGLGIGAASVSFKVPAVLRLQTRDEYLANRIESYPVFLWINENIPPDQTLLTVNTRTYYLKGRTYHNFVALLDIVGKPLDDQLDWLRKRGIRYILYLDHFTRSEKFYVETGIADMLSQWTMSRCCFELVNEMYVAQPRSGAYERAIILRVLDAPEAAS